MTKKLTAEVLIPDLTPAERARMERVESVLPAIAAAAQEADALGAFPEGHVKLLARRGPARPGRPRGVRWPRRRSA